MVSKQPIFVQENLAKLQQKSILIIKRQSKTMDALMHSLQEWGFTQLTTAINEERGWQYFMHLQPDLCIIDFNLSGKPGGGISLSEKIRSYDSFSPILFLVSKLTEEQYLQSRHVRPSAYVSDASFGIEFKQAVELALLSRIKKTGSTYPSHPDYIPQASSSCSSLFIKVGEHYKNIRYQDIEYFYARDKLTYAYTDGRSYPTNMLLKDLEVMLFPHFQRIHRKYLLNTKHIDHINLKEERVGLRDHTLPIGYVYKKSFLSHVNLIT